MKKIDNLAFVLYSHSSLQWIWKIFIQEMNKYFPIECSKYFFVDNKNILHDKNFMNIEYKDSDKYTKRLRDCLDSVKEDYILIHHEDMIFYDDVNMEQFEYYFEVLKTNDEYSFLKLIRGGLSNSLPEQFSFGIYKVQDDEQYKFTAQFAIWKKKDLIQILDWCIDNNNTYQMEEFASKYMTENNYKCLFAHNLVEDKKKGMYHWDNYYYPFMATALIKENWNDFEYDIEVQNIKLEYNII